MKTGNTRLFNRVLYIQKAYNPYYDNYYWRFWVLGFYFDTDDN